MTGLITSGFLFPALALAVAALLGAPVSLGLLVAILLSLAHLSALGLFLLRAPLGPVAVGFCLPAIAWALPALLAGMGSPGPELGRLLGAAQHLNPPSGPGRAWLQFLPVIGWVLASGLLHRAGTAGPR